MWKVQAASAGGHERIIELLLKGERQCQRVRWKVQVASVGGYEEIVVLLGQGGRRHQRVREGTGSISWRSRRIVEELLMARCDANA